MREISPISRAHREAKYQRRRQRSQTARSRHASPAANTPDAGATTGRTTATLQHPSEIGSQGHPRYWRGYKLHADVADGQIPIIALLTGASVHDSQAAIPLMTLTTQRVTVSTT